MTKKGIYNENTFRGRFKGNTDGRVSNPTLRENWDNIDWSKKYKFCPKCLRCVDLDDEECYNCGTSI